MKFYERPLWIRFAIGVWFLCVVIGTSGLALSLERDRAGAAIYFLPLTVFSVMWLLYFIEHWIKTVWGRP